MYIYLTKNNINGSMYVGQRIREYSKDGKYLGSGKIIKSAIAKYGAENFTKTLVAICKDKDELNRAEKFWIAKLNTVTPNGYNICLGGDFKSGFTGSHSKSAKLKMSKISTDRMKSAELRDRISKSVSIAQTGISRPHKSGYKWKHGHSEEARNKMSKALKGRIAPNRMPRVTKICKYCSCEFKSLEHKVRIYCSNSCRAKY